MKDISGEPGMSLSLYNTCKGITVHVISDDEKVLRAQTESMNNCKLFSAYPNC